AFKTIADGITFTAPGGTEHIVEGSYSENNNTVGKALTIDGVNPDPSKAVLSPIGPDDSHVDSPFGGAVADNGFIIASSNVTISDLTIDGGSNENFRQGIITDFRNNVVYNHTT